MKTFFFSFLFFGLQESLHSCEEKEKDPSETGWMDNGTHNVAKGDVGAMSDGSLSQSNRTNTDLCRHAFFDTIMSEKFAQLCCLLSENFQGIKVDNIIDISIINSRMKEGAYETSPMLFHSDMQQVGFFYGLPVPVPLLMTFVCFSM